MPTPEQADPRYPERVRAALASLSPSDYPNTVQAADQMADYASDRHYALVLDQRLSGIGLASSQAP